MLLAAPFVASEAGAIQLAYGPVILGAVIVAYRGIRAELARQNANNATQDIAIGVIVSQIAPMDSRIGALELGGTSMAVAQAALQAEVKAHLDWAAGRDKALTKERSRRPQGYPQQGGNQQ